MYIMHVTAVQGLIGTHITMSLSWCDDSQQVEEVASWRTFADRIPENPELGELEAFLDQTVATLVKGLSSIQDESLRQTK